ncbi:MAG: hypothetical protein Q4Q62_03435 [Thermoplasmata archaeon]|nr:hypothetical protein [Thermoplasmata archaeon]
MILDDLKDYGNPRCKLQRLVRDGAYTQVIRGLYETNPRTPGYLLAGSIRGPSYLSFEYALYRHDLIPEYIRLYTSATFGTGKVKRYETPFGRYRYRDTPSETFYMGVETIEEDGYEYRIASKEKAVCDELYIMAPIRSRKGLEGFLYDDMRIEEEDILSLDRELIRKLSRGYHCTSVNTLRDYLDEEACR